MSTAIEAYHRNNVLLDLLGKGDNLQEDGQVELYELGTHLDNRRV